MAGPRVTVWNEYRHERSNPAVAALYPDGIHAVLADALREQGIDPRTATLDDPGQGLPDDLLEATDVLVWWGHGAHDEVDDRLVERVVARALAGMGLVVLHSAHHSKVFRRLMGTSCDLAWREAQDRERLWIVAPEHPIAEGIGASIDLDIEEMYGEPFDVPPPEQLVFVSWFSGGEVMRSGCCYTRGRGRIFYFRPGHETHPTYYNRDIRRALANAVNWATPRR
jgi:trehalose utilization protein